MKESSRRPASSLENDNDDLDVVALNRRTEKEIESLDRSVSRLEDGKICESQRGNA